MTGSGVDCTDQIETEIKSKVCLTRPLAEQLDEIKYPKYREWNQKNAARSRL
jgi:hypothetical protein